MTKADLIDVVAEKLKLPRGRAEALIGQVFDCMVEALQRGEGIEIRGFGSFSIRDYKEYEGRNPRTGETVHVRPKRLAFFKVGKELRERVNENRPSDSPGRSGSNGSSGTNGSGGGGGGGASGGTVGAPPASTGSGAANLS
jgi:integration host factor subunit beta